MESDSDVDSEDLEWPRSPQCEGDSTERHEGGQPGNDHGKLTRKWLFNMLFLYFNIKFVV